MDLGCKCTHVYTVPIRLCTARVGGGGGGGGEGGGGGGFGDG